MPNPTCPQNCDSNLPVFSFSYCNPKVNSSEIQRMFFAKETAAPFTNWLNAAEWVTRLNQTSVANDDIVRALDVIGDLPAGSQVVKTISRRRNITITKDRTLPFTIDDISNENYEAARMLECNARYRWWFETEGGYMFGGNGGFLANIDINLVLARGADAAEELLATLSWRGKFMPERGLSPIFGSGSATPAVFDTILNFTTLTTDSASGVGGTVSAADADILFEFAAITTPIGTPATMNINVSSILAIVIDYPSDYTGQPFKFTDAAGIEHTGVFTNGTLNF